MGALRSRARARSCSTWRRACRPTARSWRSSCRRSRRRWPSRARSPPPARPRTRARRRPASVTDAEGEPAPPFRASIAPPTLSLVTAEDIQVAWRERRERAGSAERHIRELTLRGEVALETSGSRVGVVNGLSRLQRGRRRVRAADAHHGRRRASGAKGIIDVEREAQLGGSIHTKGVAILRGYLARMFGQERPLEPPRAARVRAELRRDRRRQRELERALRGAERARRRRRSTRGSP